MKRFLMTLALTCALSTPAVAGLIPTVGVTSPPPPGEPTTTSPSETNDRDASLQISDTLLSLIQMILAA